MLMVSFVGENTCRGWVLRGIAKIQMQAAVRSTKGEDATAFARIEDGSRTVSQGDVVRLNVKPAIMGMVLYFSVKEVCLLAGALSD